MIEKMDGVKNGYCDNCATIAELCKYERYSRGHSIAWLCGYCENMAHRDSAGTINLARSMHVLEKRIIAHLNNGGKNE